MERQPSAIRLTYLSTSHPVNASSRVRDEGESRVDRPGIDLVLLRYAWDYWSPYPVGHRQRAGPWSTHFSWVSDTELIKHHEQIRREHNDAVIICGHPPVNILRRLPPLVVSMPSIIWLLLLLLHATGKLFFTTVFPTIILTAGLDVVFYCYTATTLAAAMILGEVGANS